MTYEWRPRMKIRLLISLLFAAMLLPLYSQEKKGEAETKSVKKEEAEKKEEKKQERFEKKDKSYTVYREIILEDFETSNYTDKNVTFAFTGYQEAKLAIKDQNPAPGGSSKKYLGVKVKARAGDNFVIKPVKELIIDRYCRAISMWVYGKNYAGELSILLMDADQQTHKLRMGTLNFLGWKKLTVPLSKKIAQQDEFLNQKRSMKIIQIQYTAANREQVARWQYFYIDDISATARDKYDDKQSDEW
jgi:hypothetical protein